jgi:DNA-binding beta-propeller fold protein YncE
LRSPATTATFWSVNPDNDSVSVFTVAKDRNQKVTEIAVGREPWCVAITPDNRKVYVNQHGERHGLGHCRVPMEGR